MDWLGVNLLFKESFACGERNRFRLYAFWAASPYIEDNSSLGRLVSL